MASAILYGIAEGILKNLGSSVIQEFASAWVFESDLEKLKRHVSTIKDYLADAEVRQSDDDQAVRGWLLNLTEVIYDADDLFDEFATVATRKQLSGGNQFAKGVSMFFSPDNQIAYAARISRKIKAIRVELDAIVRVGNDFNLVRQSYKQGRMMRRRDESHSCADQVIGRDDDKNAILGSLLALPSSIEEHDVICIVGMGGMGKTALAQLIYNDPLVAENFDLKLWVCVSDEFDIKEITEKILKSATNSKIPKLEMDQLQSRLRAEIGDKKYLLVLDDVWNENREEWLKMRALLKTGTSGSKILITTRLSKTARIMCTVPPHDLGGLSKEKSWELFEKVAFAPGQMPPPDLVDIGKDIVEKCANVPLAIRVLGKILYGEDERKWLSIKNKSLAKISEKGDITSILKLSYYHLDSPSKNCFAYCALFPKDYNFNKDMLIELWMAEGFIAQPDDESQSLEELGEEYFLTLLQRGFFQDAKIDKWGLYIQSCKMHDLMHDLAQEVAGAKCKVLKVGENCQQNKIYHLSFGYRLNFQRNISTEVLSLEHLRTLLLPQQLRDGSSALRESMLKEITASLTKLRVLDLHGLGLIDLPTSIGKLVHLRYLDLSFNPICILPDSITELHNLQTLNLYSCRKLGALPTKIKRLVNLRSLDIGRCGFCHFPLGIGELTSLCKLPRFTVCSHVGSARLSDLKKLNNLRGKLHICFYGDWETTMLDAREGDLTCIHGVNELGITFMFPRRGVVKLWSWRERVGDNFYGDNELEKQVESEINVDDEVVLEGLKPHSNLRKLRISWYRSRKLPNWAMKESLVLTLSKLVEIELYIWYHCQPPAFSQLPLLKRLSLEQLPCVEYMETMMTDDGDHSSSTTLFFPSLETLELHKMDRLKGWWKGVGGEPYGAEPLGLSFPKLSKLDIRRCGNLTSLPSCPNVEQVHLFGTREKFSIMNIVTASSRLTSLSTDNGEDLLRIPAQCLLHLSHLCVKGDSSLVSTDKLGDLFATALSSSLQSLSFEFCFNLRSIAKGLEHLTALERFEIVACNRIELEFEDKDEGWTSSDDMMPWKALNTSLRSLILHGLHDLVSLPRPLRHLTNLHSLEISNFFNGFRELPEWISCFSSLQTLKLAHCRELACLPKSICHLAALQELRIEYCPDLIKRCRGPNGSEWPKIQHIPLVILED